MGYRPKPKQYRLTMKLVGIITAAPLCALAAACGSAAPQSPAHPPPSAACAAYLGTLYRQLGGDWDAGRFQAAVNAEAYAGKLGAACASPGITHAGLMRLAAQAAGAH